MRKIAAAVLAFFLALPVAAGWEDSYLPQIRAGIQDPSHRPPASLVLPKRARQMSANHDAMRLEEWYRSGDPAAVVEVRRWLLWQTEVAHTGPEQGSPVYWGFYVQPMTGISVEAYRRGDAATLDLCRRWWLHDAALRWAMRTPDLEVIGPGSRANRPHEYGLGAVLRALLGELTTRDLRVIRRGPTSPTPSLWAVQQGIELGAVPTFRPRELQDVRPPLLYPLTIWRSSAGMAAWSPVLESAGGSIPQWAVIVAFGRPLTWGDPDGSNPIYMRGTHKRTRKPQEAPEAPEWLPWVLEMEARGEAEVISLGGER